MFLHSIFLSDICDGSGMTIENHSWEGAKPSSTHKYHWPQTSKPTGREWTLWQKALTQSLNLGRNRKLAVPLGIWRTHIASQDGWFTNQTGEQLYKVTTGHWTTYSPILLRRRTKTFHFQPRTFERMDVPPPLHRATVYEHGQSTTLTGHSPIKAPPTNCDGNNNTTFETQWDYEYTIEGTAEQLCLAIIKGEAIAVSDGSFQWGNGAAAWTIEGSTARNWIIGAGRTPVKQRTKARTEANYSDCGEFSLHLLGLPRNIK